MRDRDFWVAGGLAGSSTSAKIWTRKLSEIAKFDVLIVPGGFAARKLANEGEFIAILGELARRHEHVITACTGSVLLAKTGLLDGMEATSNKLPWQRAISEALDVHWMRAAGRCVSGKFYTSSGVSAGIARLWVCLGYARSGRSAEDRRDDGVCLQ